MSAAARFLVDRRDLHRLRRAPDPDAPDARPLSDGQARLRVDQFALTANNVTYAVFGEALRYWQFFAADDADSGCVPVWGFATVVESRCPGVEAGQRVYGFLPMGRYLVVQPGRVRPRGFVDAAAHRTELAAAYNDYAACDHDPLYDAQHEGLQALLRPLFTTSFLLDDFLAGEGDFGARRLLLSSASSKTAYGTAFCVSRRTPRPDIVGLTSAGNADFVRSLGCYDEVLTYDQVATLEPSVRSVYVDFSGSGELRRTVHQHLGESLAYSSAVGASHWDVSRGRAADLPGPAPQQFFAPTRARVRAGPPPEGWGPQGLAERVAERWHAFIEALSAARPPWVQVQYAQGPAAIEQAWHAMLAGGGDPRDGVMLSPA